MMELFILEDSTQRAMNESKCPRYFPGHSSSVQAGRQARPVESNPSAERTWPGTNVHGEMKNCVNSRSIEKEDRTSLEAANEQNKLLPLRGFRRGRLWLCIEARPLKFVGARTCLFACLPVYLLACFLAYLFACLSACLFTCLLACLLACLFVCLRVRLCVAAVELFLSSQLPEAQAWRLSC